MSNNFQMSVASAIDDASHMNALSSTFWHHAAKYRHIRNTRPSSPPPLRLRTCEALPATLLEHAENHKYGSFMGLFPQIHRAWLTVDNKIFLWSYSAAHPNYSNADDLYMFEGINQIIISVALVPAPRGEFGDAAYIMAVATAFDVFLLALTITEDQVELSHTGIQARTEGVLMLKIAGTPDGRIFMAGSNGALHEFVYATNRTPRMWDLISGRPSKAIRRIQTSMIARCLPSSLRALFSRNDELVDLAIDHTRSAVYTLSEAGILTVYDISGNYEPSLVRSVHVAHESRNYVSCSLPSADREFVALHAVPAAHSSSVHLIVTTSYGERLYFCTSIRSTSMLGNIFSGQSKTKNAPPEPASPKTLKCVGYRGSPDQRASRGSHPCVHLSWCHEGITVLADLKDNESDSLICVFPDGTVTGSSNVHDTRPGVAQVSELVVKRSLDEDISSWRSVSPARFHRDQTGPARTFVIAAEELEDANDPSLTGRHFWVLTSESILSYEQVQPIDALKQLLGMENVGGSETEAFFTAHGAAEACAMCIEIGVTEPTLKHAASVALHKYGNDPKYGKRQAQPEEGETSLWRGGRRNRLSGSGFRDSSPLEPAAGTYPGRVPQPLENGSARPFFDVGRPSLQSKPVSNVSGVYDGASLWLAKALNGIWNEHIFTNRDPEGYQTLYLVEEDMQTIRQDIINALNFLERFVQDSGGDDNEFYFLSRNSPQSPHIDTPMSATGEEGGVPKKPSLTNVIEIGKKIIEGFALLQILENHQVARLLSPSIMPKLHRSLMSRVTFRDLFVEDEGMVAASALIEAIFMSYSDGESAVDHIGRLLQERCSIYFGDSDVQLHRALAVLRQAVAQEELQNSENAADQFIEGNGDRHSALQLAEEAAFLLKQVPDRIFDIKGTCEELKKVKAFSSLVDVALSIGKVAEQKGEESRYNEAYGAVLDTFEEILADDRQIDVDYAPPLRVAFGSESKIFRKRLYEVCMKSRDGELALLAEPSAGVETYLTESKNLDLLWKYFAKHGKHDDASSVLLSIAETRPNICLSERVQFLSYALHNARTAASRGIEQGTHLKEITDYLDVAKVQMKVRDHLRQSLPVGNESEEVLAGLNGEILSLTQLFNVYARPYHLYECCLAVFKCSGYRDDAFVEKLWSRITEKSAMEGTSHVPLAAKLAEIGREIYPSTITFPTSFIIDQLEKLTFENEKSGRWKDGGNWVARTMEKIGVPFSDVLASYRKMVEISQRNSTDSNQYWSVEGPKQVYIVTRVSQVIEGWLKKFEKSSARKLLPSSTDVRNVLQILPVCKNRIRSVTLIPTNEIARRLDDLEGKCDRYLTLMV